jgi:hypothetical protein
MMTYTVKIFLRLHGHMGVVSSTDRGQKEIRDKKQGVWQKNIIEIMINENRGSALGITSRLWHRQPMYWCSISDKGKRLSFLPQRPVWMGSRVHPAPSPVGTGDDFLREKVNGI